MESDGTEPSFAAPSIPKRLFSWFGIYFAAQLPFIPWGYKLNLFLWLLFPMAMEWGLAGLVSWLVPNFETGGNQHAAAILYHYAWCVAAILPWTIYIVHLICTLCVRKRRSFVILMWILVGIVLLNMAGCAYFLHAPPQ